ncbi:hypothetical protein BH23CHL5_BH23CHL5_26800 [soil metagenome]
MLRRLAETVLKEADLPPELRELFFPSPPEQGVPSRPVQRPAVGPVETASFPVESEFDPRIRRSAVGSSSGDSTTRRQRRVEPVAVKKDVGSDIRSALKNPETVQMAIVLREVLGPPKGLRREDDQEI